MKEYRKIVTFKYKNNTYNMYLDNNNKQFFLKLNEDGKLSYITIEELLEITSIIQNTPLIARAVNFERIKIVPKVIKGGVATVLSLSLLTSCANASVSSHEVVDDTTISYISNLDDEEEKEEKGLVVDTYIDGNLLNYLYIYDMDYLDMAMDSYSVSLDDLYEVIDNNNSISPRIKAVIKEYCYSLVNKYPDVELRVLYENLKTLTVIESTAELRKKDLNVSTSALYYRPGNTIYLSDDISLEKGSWDYQVVYHELSHVLRIREYNDGKKQIKIKPEGQNFPSDITMETLNSLFAVSLLDYESDEIAYQLQSNYFNVMLECMDNYELADYVNHSVSYFAKKLDEYNGDENEATAILSLIQMQYASLYNSNIDVNNTDFNKIYDYIAKMYYDKYITDDMTYDEMQMVATDLINKISLEIPDGTYNIDYNYFYDYLDSYSKNLENDVLGHGKIN